MTKKISKEMRGDKEPMFVKSHDIHLDEEYVHWIADIKHRYRSAQVKAALKVNSEKLLFNWQLGRDLVQKKAEERWGAGVVEQVSLDLKREFPDSTNFSVRNLWYMKQWYLFYAGNLGKLKQLVSVMLPDDNYDKKIKQIADTEKLKHFVSEFPVQVVFDTKTFWLSQQRMAELFGVTQQNISYHLSQIEESGELHLSDAYKKNLLPSDKWSGDVMMYNLDVVIAVGYRVNTARCRKCDA